MLDQQNITKEIQREHQRFLNIHDQNKNKNGDRGTE